MVYDGSIIGRRYTEKRRIFNLIINLLQMLIHCELYGDGVNIVLSKVPTLIVELLKTRIYILEAHVYNTNIM